MIIEDMGKNSTAIECMNCGRGDCPKLTTRRKCHGEIDWHCPDCMAMERADSDCRSHAVDWYARTKDLTAQLAIANGAVDNLEIALQDLHCKREPDRWRDMEAEPPPDDDDDMIRVWGCCDEYDEPWQEVVLNSLSPNERDDWTFTHWRPAATDPRLLPT